MDAAGVVGRLVSSRLTDNPRTARRLLEAAYTYVNLAGKVAPREGGIGAAISRFNGSVAKGIVDSFCHPERAAIVNVFMPCELLHALGVTPMFPEGISVYVACTRCPECFCEAAESRGIPESFCSYHKLMLGMSAMEVMPSPAMVVNTTLACDANQVSFRAIAEGLGREGASGGDAGVPHVVIDVPEAVDGATVAYVAAQLRDLAAQLERTFGRELSMEALKAACRRSKQTLANVREFARRRGEATLPMTLTGELCVLIATHIMLGSPEALRFSWELLRELAGAPAASEGDVPRVFWVHTLPNWQKAMVEMFDDACRAELVGNDMAYDALGALDELDPEDPFDFMARRLVANSANGRSERRIDAALAEALAARADGVVIFGHWGCKQTQGLAQLGRRAFEAHGLPTLVLDGDGCDPRNVSDGQMVTRVAAFLEQLEDGREAEPLSA